MLLLAAAFKVQRPASGFCTELLFKGVSVHAAAATFCSLIYEHE